MTLGVQVTLARESYMLQPEMWTQSQHVGLKAASHWAFNQLENSLGMC